MKSFLIGTGIVVFLLAGSVWWSKGLQKNDPDVITRSGFHWHPKLTIYVKGEKLDIPSNIGLGAVHLPMHTHLEDAKQGIINFEFGGVVKKQDITLKKFFEIWGKDINNAFGTLISMTVNGRENTELGEYVMRHGDKIELRYE